MDRWELLNEARRELSKIEDECRDEAHSIPATTDVRAYGLGRVAEAASRAEGAIFDVLSASQAYLDDEAAGQAIKNFYDVPAEAKA